MTWFKVDDGFPEHRKLEELEANADEWAACLAVWLAAGCDCSRRLTEGKISAARLSRITPFGRKAVAIADRLVGLNLWEKHGIDYTFHDWHDYQPEAEVVEENREKSRERWREWKKRKREQRAANALATTTTNAVANAFANVPLTASRPDPIPTRIPSPDPVPTRPPPDLDQSESPARASGVSLRDFGDQVANNGLAIQLGRSDRERFSKLAPVEQYEIDHALARSKGKGVGYALSVIEGERTDALKAKDQPPSQAPPRRNMSPSEERAQENATRIEAERLERKRLRSLGKSGDEIEQIEKQNRQAGADHG